MTIKGQITVDATECGDLLPLTPARYRVGNSISPNVNLDGEIQDITWVAVVKKQGEVPQKLIAQEPEGYGRDVGRFRKVVRLDGSTWPGSYPFDIPSFNAYRALPDRENPNPIDGGEPSTWGWITKTALNWGNDVSGQRRGPYGPHSEIPGGQGLPQDDKRRGGKPDPQAHKIPTERARHGLDR